MNMRVVMKMKDADQNVDKFDALKCVTACRSAVIGQRG